MRHISGVKFATVLNRSKNTVILIIYLKKIRFRQGGAVLGGDVAVKHYFNVSILFQKNMLADILHKVNIGKKK